MWTAGSDGAGSWQKPSSSSIYKLNNYGTFNHYKDYVTSDTVPLYPITGDSLDIDFNGNLMVFGRNISVGSSSSGTVYRYPELSTARLELIAGEILGVSDLSTIPDGNFSFEISFGVNEEKTTSYTGILNLSISGGTPTVSMEYHSGQTTNYVYGNKATIHWFLRSFTVG